MFRDFFQTMIDRIKNEENINTNMPGLGSGLDDFINFKRNIVKGLLICKLEINLPPSFINHQINEAMEFKFELTAPQNFMECLQNHMCSIDLLKKWIADASGHAATYDSLLEPVESIFREQALAFKSKFDMLSVKSNELQIMTQSGVGASALELRCNCKVMAVGALTPILPEHMIREHQYVIGKIDE